MANEIWHTWDEAGVLYALIWDASNDKIWDNANSEWDTPYTDADILDYDVPLTNHADSDYHSVDFPSAIAAGVYRVQVMLQVGGGIDADADIGVAQGEIYWDGSAEYNLSTLMAYILSDVIGADGDTLETLSDQLDGLTATKYTKTNVYGPNE